MGSTLKRDAKTPESTRREQRHCARAIMSGTCSFGNAAPTPHAPHVTPHPQKQNPAHFRAPGSEPNGNAAPPYFRSSEYRPGPVSASNSNPPMMLTFL